jgi:hypothetical protein
LEGLAAGSASSSSPATATAVSAVAPATTHTFPAVGRPAHHCPVDSTAPAASSPCSISRRFARTSRAPTSIGRPATGARLPSGDSTASAYRPGGTGAIA